MNFEQIWVMIVLERQFHVTYGGGSLGNGQQDIKMYLKSNSIYFGPVVSIPKSSGKYCTIRFPTVPKKNILW